MNYSLMNKLLPAAVLLSSLTGTAALATEAATATAVEPSDTLTVTGNRRTNERMRIMLDFVHKLSGQLDSYYGYARLEEPPCFLIQNLVAAEVKFLSERLTAAAKEAGLEAPRAGCRPNISIFFTDDARKLANYIAQNHKTVIKPFGNAEGTTKDSHALADFKNSDAAVRWWQITMPVDWSGTPTIDPSNPELHLTVEGMESRMFRNVRDRLVHTMIIVDHSRIGDATWDQLADYLAMVALVQVRPHTNLAGYDSILNLFDKGVGKLPPAMSDWDKAYLRGVYSVNRYLMPWTQTTALAGQVLDNLYK